ncbi:pyridoxal4-dehydrogenase Pld [Octadecabacter arcticus 238]|jgi:D-threo-aldose 1-dehydrogenase|uniref:Pyridoxal4-dehydrogenase Pld n=1 Tax=Octadecabacter arcticus 238 TaxID=391616 RepID=M9RL56_9RHOB|nr:aldo/keto reductase [Octadecabacter arcticus]AGI72478.1 pyridoxal4-dehydrogenase Pld [Octadecabacter arcticus 238]
MTPDQTCRVGNTDLRIPVMGLGTCPLGGIYASIGELEAQASFEAAWESGLRFYDTAPWYGTGQAEHRTGRALYDKPRADYSLTSKVGRVLRAPRDRVAYTQSRWADALEFEVDHIFTYDAIMRSYEDSLQRLGLNRIDALYIHDLDTGHFPDPDAFEARFQELEHGGYRALEELKSSGEIKAIGAGINERGLIPRFLDGADLDVFLVASRYTLLEQEIYNKEIVPAGRRGASMVIGGAFNSGVLATGLTGDAKYEYGVVPTDIAFRVKRLWSIASDHGIPLAAAALQFPLAAPEVTSVVFGAVSPEEVRANIAHFKLKIPNGFWSDVRSEGLVLEDAILPDGED